MHACMRAQPKSLQAVHCKSHPHARARAQPKSFAFQCTVVHCKSHSRARAHTAEIFFQHCTAVHCKSHPHARAHTAEVFLRQCSANSALQITPHARAHSRTQGPPRHGYTFAYPRMRSCRQLLRRTPHSQRWHVLCMCREIFIHSGGFGCLLRLLSRRRRA